MPRKRVEWKIKNELLRLGERTLLVGVMNVTPDSLFDAGRHMDPDLAYVRALQIADEGADILEIGVESQRAGAARVSEAEELRRLIPVLKRLKGKLVVPVCVETNKAAVAEKALEHGATIIKDPATLSLDPDLAKVVARYDAGLIIQHMRGTPDTFAKLGGMKDPVMTVLTELNAAIGRALRAGVERERIVVDPGFGIGKRREQNTELLTGLDEFSKLRGPIMVSPSGKQFNAALPLEPGLAMTIAAATMAVLRGAHLLRLHEVAAVRPAVLVADAALRD